MRQAAIPLPWVLMSLLLGATPLLGQDATAAAPGGQAPASRPLRMLLLHRTLEMDPAYVQELQAAGISVTQRGLTDATSLPEFGSYHVVVLPDFLTLDAGFQVGAVDVPNWWDATLPNLRRHTERGGGLLMATFFDEGGEALSAPTNRMIGSWGAVLLALDLGYRPEPDRKEFVFSPPREATFEFQLPLYLRKPADVFRADADGVHDVDWRPANEGVCIHDAQAKVAVYVAAADRTLRAQLAARGEELVAEEEALGCNPARSDAGFAALQALLADNDR